MAQYSLPGRSRLKGRKATEQLWAGGQSAGKGMLKARYRLQATEAPVSQTILVGFSAPKKWFRKAVQRNRCKRLLRECWRHRSAVLAQALHQHLPGQQLHLFWVMSQPEIPDLLALGQAMDAVIHQLEKRFAHDAQKAAGAAPAGLD